MRKMTRNAQLANNEKVGIPKSKIWGGKPTTKQMRNEFKKKIQNEDF